MANLRVSKGVAPFDMACMSDGYMAGDVCESSVIVWSEAIDGDEWAGKSRQQVVDGFNQLIEEQSAILKDTVLGSFAASVLVECEFGRAMLKSLTNGSDISKPMVYVMTQLVLEKLYDGDDAIDAGYMRAVSKAQVSVRKLLNAASEYGAQCSVLRAQRDALIKQMDKG